jgi:hypothetical protein
MSIQRLSNAGQSGFRYKSLIAGITPVASVPVIGEATAVTFSTASVTFTAPGAYAGSTYTATSSPGGLTGTSASSPITVSGLSGDTAYTFTVTATNATGTSGPSAASNSITTPTEFVPESGYDALATVTLASSASTVTFAGIPSGYKHLQIRIMNLSSSAESDIVMRFNADSGANYSQHAIYGGGSGTPGSYGTINSTYASAGLTGGTTYPSVSIIDILDYANTNKFKTTRSLSGDDTNGAGYIFYYSGNWRSTNAITSITLTHFQSANFNQNSSFALHGVK